MMLLAACALGASPLTSCSSDDSFQDGPAASADAAVTSDAIADVHIATEGNIFPSYDAATDANDLLDAADAANASDAGDE
ncbi:MAG: hypothetical protein ABI183_04495 [Polyangiaceae bacterium]